MFVPGVWQLISFFSGIILLALFIVVPIVLIVGFFALKKRIDRLEAQMRQNHSNSNLLRE